MGLIGSAELLLDISEKIYHYRVYTDDFMYVFDFYREDNPFLLLELVKSFDFESQTIEGCFVRVLNNIYPELIYKTSSNPSELANLLPGVKSKVQHPVSGVENSLMAVIIDLNDRSQSDKGRNWTREEIADWIESALPLEDITFKQEVNDETTVLSKSTRLVKVTRIL